MLVKDLFIDKDHGIKSWSYYNRIVLTGYLAIAGFGLAILYIFYDLIIGLDGYTALFFLFALSSLGCLVLLRKGYYGLAKLIFIFSGLAVVCPLAIKSPMRTGIDFYFVIIAMESMALFDFKNVKTGFALCAVTLATYILIFVLRYSIENIEVYDGPADQLFFVNLLISMVFSTLIIYYLMASSYYSEQEMKKTENNLYQITRELADSKKRFELAIQGSSAGIWDWNFKTQTLYISPQLRKILGYGKHDKEWVTFEEIVKHIHSDDIRLLKRKLVRHVRHKQKFEITFRLKRKDGHYIWVLDTGQAEWNEKGKAQRMVGSVVDINDRMRAEHEVQEKNTMLERSNEELDRFVYMTSHDLRAPLNSVIGLISLAQTTTDPEESQKCLVLMRESIETLNGFISDIINYSRNSRLDIAYEKANLFDIVQNILNNLEYFEHQKGIRIEKCFDKTFELKTDKSRLRIILNNLLSNAIKYHKLDQVDPRILIRASRSDHQVVLEVEDNGPGIEKEFQSKVFDMFFRATTDSEGSGLGLYIAREMTEKLNGQLVMKSQPNKGTVFTLTLPQTN